MSLTATGQRRLRWSASQTWPIPPLPSNRTRRYLPASTSWGRGSSMTDLNLARASSAGKRGLELRCDAPVSVAVFEGVDDDLGRCRAAASRPVDLYVDFGHVGRVVHRGAAG